MAQDVEIPEVGESISEVEVSEWRKAEGDAVERDETLCVLETDKTSVDVPAPVAGVVTKITIQEGETAQVGDVLCTIDPDAKASKGSGGGKQKGAKSKSGGKKSAAGATADAKPDSSAAESGADDESDAGDEQTAEAPRVMPAARRLLEESGLDASDVPATGPGGRLLKEDVLRHLSSTQSDDSADTGADASRGSAAKSSGVRAGGEERARPAGARHEARREEVVPMNRLRRRIAERLVDAQRQAALLTTFNEADMTAVMNARKQYRDAFVEEFDIKLGFMSFFVKAAVDALARYPAINAEIRGTDIVYRNYHDIGIAVGGGRGLVVPVLRDADSMSFAEIELQIGDYAKRAQTDDLELEELTGGTFTISNGGVYGSLLSTPIVNPPQSGILGLHKIEERPVARDGQVVIRPMMYLALTYDHRIVDGREAVTFLRRIKETIEDPLRILIEV